MALLCIPLCHPSTTIAHLAARALLLDLLAAKGNTRFGRRSSTGLVLHPRLDLASHGQESLLDIRRSLGRCLQKLNAKSICKLLPLLSGNDTLSFEIAFITYEKLVNVFAGIPVNFVQPLLDIVEGLIVRYIIDDDDAVGSSVVGRGDGTETLLSGCVPNLELDCLPIKFNCADFLQR